MEIDEINERRVSASVSPRLVNGSLVAAMHWVLESGKKLAVENFLRV
jgi:hypothetical protein